MTKQASVASLSASDYVKWHECPLKLHLSRYPAANLPRDLWQTVGDSIHLAVGSDDSAADIDSLLAPLSPEKQERVQRLVDGMSERVRLARKRRTSCGQVVHYRHEKQYIFTDPVSGCRLFAKPDETLVLQVDSDFIAQITDVKSGGNPELKSDRKKRQVTRKRYRQQLYFFALVWSLSFGWEGLIRLVADCLAIDEDASDQAGELEFIYDTDWNETLLAEIRQIIAEIKESERTGKVRYRLNARCRKCQVKDICPAFQKKLEGGASANG